MPEGVWIINAMYYQTIDPIQCRQASPHLGICLHSLRYFGYHRTGQRMGMGNPVMLDWDELGIGWWYRVTGVAW